MKQHKNKFIICFLSTLFLLSTKTYSRELRRRRTGSVTTSKLPPDPYLHDEINF
jgi:hypothetical protein